MQRLREQLVKLKVGEAEAEETAISLAVDVTPGSLLLHSDRFTGAEFR